jgi:hypothetical protein
MSGLKLNDVILVGNAGHEGATSSTKAAESEAVHFVRPSTKNDPQSEIFA